MSLIYLAILKRNRVGSKNFTMDTMTGHCNDLEFKQFAYFYWLPYRSVQSMNVNDCEHIWQRKIYCSLKSFKLDSQTHAAPVKIKNRQLNLSLGDIIWTTRPELNNISVSSSSLVICCSAFQSYQMLENNGRKFGHNHITTPIGHTVM